MISTREFSYVEKINRLEEALRAAKIENEKLRAKVQELAKVRAIARKATQ